MEVEVPIVSPGIVGVGYEGQTLEEFVERLVMAGVPRLVDFRMTPISRKRGLSKTALGAALAEAGIRYEHRRELGNPKSNRAGFGGSPEERREAKAVFAGLLEFSDAADALDALAEASRRERVAVLCFEADQSRCHRDVVLREVERRRSTASGSTRPAR
ncbi:hypothetical protein GCM10020218_041730 [Dactylosporangium vinaceum]